MEAAHIEIREARTEAEEVDAAELMAAYLRWVRSSYVSNMALRTPRRIRRKSGLG
jgi:hypothetical protein